MPIMRFFFLFFFFPKNCFFSQRGETALSRACSSNDEETVKLLLNAGANVNTFDQVISFSLF